MNKQTVYQLDSSNNVKQWSVEVIDHGTHCEILTIAGRVGGALTPTTTLVNTGKRNLTCYEQACSEAQSKYDAKIKKGYVTDINNVKASTELGSGMKSPMLAEKYHVTGKQSSSKTLAQIGIVGEKIGIQRKKDGNRCNAKVTLNSCKLSTRKGESFAPLSHIEKQMIECFQKIYKYVNEKYGVTEYEIDGELMPPKDENGVQLFSFNKLNGLVKNYSRNEEEEKLASMIEYHVYDIVLPVGYETRDKIKNYFSNTHIKPLETIYITADDITLKKYHDQFIEEGEEGLMIRRLGMPYEHKRTWQLCKMKMFEDAEFEIVGVEESVRPGQAGALIMKAPKNCFDRDGKLIETFKAALKFSHEERKMIWNNINKLLGTECTVNYFGLSEYGIPRFPRATKLRKGWDK